MHYGGDAVPCNQNQGMLRNCSGRHAVRAVTHFLSGDRSRLSDLSLSRLSCSLICSSLRRRAALTRSCSACFTEKTNRWAPPSWCQTKDSCSLVWSSLCCMLHKKRPKWAPPSSCQTKDSCSLVWSSMCCMLHKKRPKAKHQCHVKQWIAVLWSGPPPVLCIWQLSPKAVQQRVHFKQGTANIENSIAFITQSTLACMHFSPATGKHGTA